MAVKVAIINTRFCEKSFREGGETSLPFRQLELTELSQIPIQGMTERLFGIAFPKDSGKGTERLLLPAESKSLFLQIIGRVEVNEEYRYPCDSFEDYRMCVSIQEESAFLVENRRVA